VPCTLDDVAATAVETGSTAVLVDLPGPHPVVIERELIDELAQAGVASSNSPTAASAGCFGRRRTAVSPPRVGRASGISYHGVVRPPFEVRPKQVE
jgi:hypothetical protein